MRKILFLFLFTISCINLFTQEFFNIEAVPKTVDDFVKLRDTIATTPEGGAVCFIIAMIKYTEDKNAGMQFFTAILVNDNTLLRKTKEGGYKGMEPGSSAQFLIKQLDYSPWISFSYLLGTSPENCYTVDGPPFTIQLSRNAYSESQNGSIKVFVSCSGADTPRPVTLKPNNNGIWKVSEFSSLVTDIRKPANNFVDEL